MHLVGIADQSSVRPFRKTKLSMTSQGALQLLRMISQCILMETKAMGAHLQSSKGMLCSGLHRSALLVALSRLHVRQVLLVRDHSLVPICTSHNCLQKWTRRVLKQRSCIISPKTHLTCLFRQDEPWRWVDSEDALRTYLVFFGILLAGELAPLKV